MAYRIVFTSSVYIEDLVTASKINHNKRTQPGDTLSTEKVCLLLPNYQQLSVTAMTYICYGHT